MATPNSTVMPERQAAHLWERQARPAIESIVEPGRPMRGVISGTAGAGKTAVLAEIERLLIEQDRPHRFLDEAADVHAIPADAVLLVDDLHQVPPAQLAALLDRAEDLSASLVVASRPSAQRAELGRVRHALERSRPAIVLGTVSRSDVLTFLEDSDRRAEIACVDAILECTGGVSWLVAEALALHDPRDCAPDRQHRAVRRAVEERVAHRLETIDPALRDEVVARCLSSSPHGDGSPHQEDLVAEGYAEGLLLRNGRPAPVVRSAVRSAMPTTRMGGIAASAVQTLALSAAGSEDAFADWVSGEADAAFGRNLVEQADRLLEREPARALELYAAALECGIGEVELTGRRAQAAWATGDLEAASSMLDDVSLLDGVRDGDRVADTSAAIWASRGMLRMSDAVYRSLPPVGAESCARATIAAVGVGDAASLGAPEAGHGLPSTLGVAMELLDRGLRESLRPDGAEAAVADLVRASEMYTASGSAAPLPELPAVIAAIVAIGVGELEIAQSSIDDALSGGQGGAIARTRLLLWKSWLAVQRARPVDARQALADAVKGDAVLSARDAMLAHAIRVAIARRYEDAAALDAIWVDARDSVLRTETDLYTLLPLTELVAAAARVDDTARVQPHFARALEIVERLGAPPVWAAHVHWSGIQQGILLNRPDDLKPHARVLVAASTHSAVAAVMAQAGRVWTATLAGSVDADAIEAAAHGLASAGLGWDGARLAGHGAGKSTDRRVSARLLSVARELHPNDGSRTPRSADTGAVAVQKRSDESGGIVLSERERDVARLVLQGKTYAEIGQTIFISPRTAEHHIAHIRRRLGATSRSDLVAKLRVVVEDATSSAESQGTPPGSP